MGFISNLLLKLKRPKNWSSMTKEQKSDWLIENDPETGKAFNEWKKATEDTTKSLDETLRKRGIDPKKFEV
jgi:hypothetical protein